MGRRIKEHDLGAHTDILRGLEWIIRQVSNDPAATLTPGPIEADQQVVCVNVHPYNVKFLVGKNGQTIGGLRSILRALSWRSGITIRLDVADSRNDSQSTKATQEDKDHAIQAGSAV